jgi:hypothetical protein
MEFENLPLHDSVLETIEYQWDSHQVKISGSLCCKKPTSFNLVFIGVMNLEIPNKKEWGPSNSINEVTLNSGGIYEIEMQSGDNIKIKAQKFSYGIKET